MDQCPFCGEPARRDARFCQNCGRQLVSQRVSAQKAVLTEDFDVGAVQRLREERSQLSKALNELLAIAAERDLTPDERGRWNELRGKYTKVATELSARLQHLSARQDRDRRQSEQRQSDRRQEQAAITFDDRRSGIERRIGERRSGEDRRDPFADKDL